MTMHLLLNTATCFLSTKRGNVASSIVQKPTAFLFENWQFVDMAAAVVNHQVNLLQQQLKLFSAPRSVPSRSSSPGAANDDAFC